MVIARKIVLACTVAALALPATIAIAQQSKAQVKNDIATWAQALTAAFAPGYWEGETREYGADGKLIDVDTAPSCVKPGEGAQFGKELEEMVSTLPDVADCATVSGGKGSLNMTLTCTIADGRKVQIKSSGQYSPNAIDVKVEFQADGDDAGDGGTMTYVAKRTKPTC